MLGDLFYRLGATVGTLEAQLEGLRGRAVTAGIDAPDDSAQVVLSAAGAWLATRMLRPRPVSWPRVVVSGVAATLVADLVGRTGRAHPEPREEAITRLGAGVAVAAGYAALVYPRLPGPPLLRGLAFGALEVAAAPRGGLLEVARGLPGVKLPLHALVTPADDDSGPASQMAFGLALGLLYRYDD